ncbi:phosphoribosylformylglycinamidine synthase [Flagellimonas taeanensis]|uniref:HAEPLYID family protein n=1 Tax=Flavobacteriaceae TaxID=49546 RepID=UPI000E67DA83|nr:MULTISPECIES: HAEPLYID family protein [Allomuricauda]MDC6385444.1 phosphoribosylformylglycinamidine synthase [Muricauda sp. SK9]RIV53043.1 phosphoribosylformylglycinamidine synthase [Allomuricauda taeanensis]
MKFKKILLPILFLAAPSCLIAQISNIEKDSLYLVEVEDQKEPDKVLHAEPLYIDLIRDLGARKGEKEWNIGLGLTDNLSFDSYEALIEYEWAPMDRLGLEVELPFTFYSSVNGTPREAIPSNKLNSIKVAFQWSFFVNEPMATSMAFGYINEFELSDFKDFGRPLITGNVYNPFFVVAKRWGSNFHSLIYTGPMFEQVFENNTFHTSYDINTSFHYMIPGTRNFIGAEFNKTLEKDDFDMTLRPQMRVGIADNLIIGIIAGIPIDRENERISSFLRLIWEPKHHN